MAKHKFLSLSVLAFVFSLVGCSSGPKATQALEIVPLNENECAVGIGNAFLLDKIVIPEKINNYTVTSVGFSQEVYEAIGTNKILGFGNASFLKEIQLPKTVKTIGVKAFNNCDSLETISFYGVESIEYGAFRGCTSLENVNFKGDVEDWCNIDFDDIDSNPMTYAKNHSFITNKNNFSGSIVIPKTIDVIKKYQFASFEGMTQITLSTNLTKIEEQAFYGCVDLLSIDIHDQLRNIENDAFYGCEYLSRVYLEEVESFWFDISFENRYSNPLCYGASFMTDDNYNDTYTVPEHIKTIGRYQFYNCKGMYDIIFHDEVESIEAYAFYGCTGLHSLELPNNLVSIGEGAFSMCESLSSLELPEKIKEINSYTFYNTGFDEVVIPKNIISIKSYAFADCYYLRKVIYGGSYVRWSNRVTVSPLAFPEDVQLQFLEEPSSEDYEVISISEALSSPDGYYVAVTGIVKTVEPWSTTHNNMSFTIIDYSYDELYCYRAVTKVRVGDRVIVYGCLKTYEGKKEIAQGGEVTIISSDNPIPGGSDEGTKMSISECFDAPKDLMVNVSGYVKKVFFEDCIEEQYAFVLIDSSYNELYCEGTYTSLDVGDYVTAIGYINIYGDSKKEVVLGNSASVVIHNSYGYLPITFNSTHLDLVDNYVVNVDSTETVWENDYFKFSCGGRVVKRNAHIRIYASGETNTFTLKNTDTYKYFIIKTISPGHAMSAKKLLLDTNPGLNITIDVTQLKISITSELKSFSFISGTQLRFIDLCLSST